MINNIKAEIITHSKREGTGEELITYKLTYPRIILSEANTYKMLEKNTSSSRAIPFEKMVEVVEKEPFIPIAWQKHHRGMQGTEYITDPKQIQFKMDTWLEARDKAVECAHKLYEDATFVCAEGNRKWKETYDGTSKQLVNRLLEPWMWVTQLCTGTRESFEHLFHQRCPQYEFYFGKSKSKKEVLEYINIGEIEYPKPFPKTDLEWLQHNTGQAEIHFMDLAEKMYDALQESQPQILKPGDWHIPFRNEIDSNLSIEDQIKISVSKTAKISYTKIGDENSISVEKAREMHDKLKNSGHWSCFGHIGRCMEDYEYDSWIKGKCQPIGFSEFEEETFLEIPSNKEKGWNRNLKGFLSYRHIVEDTE